ncbi:unnamed protein product [Peniophora sp. CBMAI 1063]|nr:unnamed protein product [Peniophora sp. CBMAI 1063]
MVDSLLNAPTDLSRVLQGLDIPSPEQPQGSVGNSPRDAHYKSYMASAFIYACVDNDSTNWSHYYLSPSAEQSTIVSDSSDAPRISICESDDCDQLLKDTICDALPGLTNLYARPSEQLCSNADTWRCPVERCCKAVRPFNLTQEQCDVVTTLAGAFDTMLVRGSNGRVRLRREDPWAFLRYIDAVAWEHISWHLHRVHITFYYPHPQAPYKELPGWWWNETLLTRDEPLFRLVQDFEATSRQNRRQWLVTKAIESSHRKIQRAQARLTRWRYDALEARRELVATMFNLNRSVVDVGRSLLTLVRQQEADTRGQTYTAEIAHYREAEREWAEEQHMWG